MFPPHVSSAALFFFFGRQGNIQEKHWHTMLSLPEHKRETFQPGVWASETNRKLAHHHGEKERWALCWFVPWMKSLQAEIYFFFFCQLLFFFRSHYRVSLTKRFQTSENIFWGRSGGCWRWKVDVVITSRFLSSLLKLSRAHSHSCRFLQR